MNRSTRRYTEHSVTQYINQHFLGTVTTKRYILCYLKFLSRKLHRSSVILTAISSRKSFLSKAWTSSSISATMLSALAVSVLGIESVWRQLWYWSSNLQIRGKKKKALFTTLCIYTLQYFLREDNIVSFFLTFLQMIRHKSMRGSLPKLNISQGSDIFPRV